MLIIYFLTGAIYAYFNYNTNKGTIGYIKDTILWPIDITRNLMIGWNKAKGKDLLIAQVNIKQCHNSMEEFHNILSDTILEETGKGLAEQPEELRTGILVYEIQAALAAAKKFRLGQQYHRDFAASVLTRGGIPRDEATGMVDAVISDNSERMMWFEEAINGAEGYKVLTLGTDELAQHVRDTLRKLQSQENVLNEILAL